MTTYIDLPSVGSQILPRLERNITPNSSSRLGAPVTKIWEHRWGGGTFGGTESWLDNPVSRASSHLVYAGERGRDAGRCVQMVPWNRKAWTEGFFNRTGISIESADAIWLGKDPEGFACLARITAFLCQENKLPPNWRRGRTLPLRGFTRHADGLAAAGGHVFCPTTDMELWWQFVSRVKQEAKHGHFRASWGF